ncbi:hypothetical protein [Leptolinea tardivitalis]|nr:hypothetical protein [Leptolinea tardivitalis]
MGLVKLEENSVFTAQLTDLVEKQPRIGLPVEMGTRKIREDAI